MSEHATLFYNIKTKVLIKSLLFYLEIDLFQMANTITCTKRQGAGKNKSKLMGIKLTSKAHLAFFNDKHPCQKRIGAS